MAIARLIIVRWAAKWVAGALGTVDLRFYAAQGLFTDAARPR